MRKKTNNVNSKIIMLIALIIVSISAISYGAFFVTRVQSNDNVISSSCFSTTFTGESSSLSLEKALPMTDEEGQSTTPYSFTITNTCNLNADYYVIISKTTGSTLGSNNIKYIVNSSSAEILGNAPSSTFEVDSGYTEARVISSGSLWAGHSITIDVRLWIKSDATYSQIHGQSWSGQIKVVNKASINQSLTLADYIISTYGTDNTLYYHTNTSALWQNGESTYSSLLAGDNSYRYSGASANVNNYVCFGTTDTSTCTSSPDTYLYRIIGVFNGQVKLIKATSLGNMSWNENASVNGGGSNDGNDLETEEKYKIQLLSNAVRLSDYYNNDWEHSSTLNAYLNTDSSGYLQTMNNTWRALIDATHSWHVTSFYASSSDAAKVTYTNEIGNTNATWSGAVGLMYVSDYGYAASPSSWSTSLYSYNSVSSTDWLFLGSREWTISPYFYYDGDAWGVYSNGNLVSFVVNGGYAVRPVFYLASTTQIDTSVTSADGSSSHPYILKTQ